MQRALWTVRLKLAVNYQLFHQNWSNKVVYNTHDLEGNIYSLSTYFTQQFTSKYFLSSQHGTIFDKPTLLLIWELNSRSNFTGYFGSTGMIIVYPITWVTGTKNISYFVNTKKVRQNQTDF
jgi:hypothetical protein